MSIYGNILARYTSVLLGILRAVTLMDGSQIDFFMKVFFLGCEWDADMTSFKQMYFIDFSKAVLQTKLQCFLRYFSELSHFLLKLE